MITPAELAAIPLFAEVTPEHLARVAENAADLRLGVGDFAANEGDERALYIMLDGKVEVIKMIDGLERIIGQRSPGDVFGEIPIIFGIPFQGSFRATEASRVMRVDAQDYHALAAAEPSVLTSLADLARERMGGLQGIAAQPAKPRALIVADPSGHPRAGGAPSASDEPAAE